MTLALDATDRAILRILAADATRSAAEVGRAVGIGQPAQNDGNAAVGGGGD